MVGGYICALSQWVGEFVPINQFQQHFTCSFFADFHLAKKLLTISFAKNTWVQKLVLKKMMKLSTGVNFINILQADFMSEDSKSTKNTVKLSVFLCFRDLRT
jgi:hypothetical protein